MARIRTIKPEFFTSEDIVELSAYARLLYIALWCEADREGRLSWKPRTFKIRYFPADEIVIDDLCEEILARGLVVQYGDGLACIPTFLEHQHVNPRESASTLPDPNDHACPTRAPRVSDAHPRVSDVQGGREGKERKDKGASVLPDFIPTESWEGFLEMRKKIKKPMTDRAVAMMFKKLGDMHSNGHDVGAALDASTLNNWQDVYTPKGGAVSPEGFYVPPGKRYMPGVGFVDEVPS